MADTRLSHADPATEGAGWRVLQAESYGWRRQAIGPAILWLKGHLFDAEENRLHKAVAAGAQALAALVPSLDGFFGLIVETDQFVFAATDRTGSIPVFLAQPEATGSWLVGGDALRLSQTAGLQRVNGRAALALGMAGYTIGNDALLHDLRHLRAGEWALLRQGETTPVFCGAEPYQPWQVRPQSESCLQDDLSDVLTAVIRKLIRSANGRCIALPLSAGLDSRVIAAGLKQFGYRNLRCYAYGIPGNHEAQMSRQIADRLGLNWMFIPATPETQGRFFASEDCAAFTRFADTLTAIPFQQDYDATRRLLQTGYLPEDAIFVNGQSGDYITGNHIPAALWSVGPDDPAARWNRILSALCTKHFSLWQFLNTPANTAMIFAALQADMQRQGGLPDSPEFDWAMFEASEYIHRQSRYVIAGQRTYEHLGHDWRLPLWDRLLIDFYEHAPLSAKQSQVLYRNVLRRLNWGGVWGDDMPVNHRNIRPRWIQPVRMVAKLASAPFGRERWRRLERRFLAWWMDPVANYAVVPWRQVATDRRGARNAIAWHAEAYLKRHGITLSDLAAGRAA